MDGLLPAKIMRPQDPEDAARGLRRCAQAGAAVIVHGGGTQLGLGLPPRRYDVAFSTLRLDRLLEHAPADLTCRAMAGMRLAQLQQALLPSGQRLPFDPPHPERATLGGILAANTNGLSRARYGTIRDWVIGIAVASPTGKVTRAGGKVVKNVAGYDLMKLHIGALGTLGVLVEVNFKVQTIPQARGSILARFETPLDGLAAGHQLARRYLRPAALVLFNRDGLAQAGLAVDSPWVLAAQVEGHRREIEAARGDVVAAVREHGGKVEADEPPPGFWDAVRDWPAPEDGGVVLRAMSSLTGLRSLLEAIGHDGAVVAQPAAGILHIRAGPGAGTLLERLRRTASGTGEVIVERAPAELKPALDVWGPPPGGFALMQGLKHALDPGSILNPGRYVGGL